MELNLGKELLTLGLNYRILVLTMKIFFKEKIAWIDLVKNGRFAYDKGKFLCDKTCFFLTGTHIKYLCAFLNSTLVHWFFQQEAPTSGMGVFCWGKVYVEKIPVPKIIPENEKLFTKIVDQIIDRKRDSLEDLTQKLENELDKLVYKTYGLTHKEVSVIEKGKP